MINQLYRDIWKYAYSGRASWLHEFAWQKIPVKPLKFGVEGVVTAMYCAMTDKLKIADDLSDEVYFGSVIHELYHAYQRHTTEWLDDQRIKQWKEKHKYEQHSNN